jgi:hypothetical protein
MREVQFRAKFYNMILRFTCTTPRRPEGAYEVISHALLTLNLRGNGLLFHSSDYFTSERTLGRWTSVLCRSENNGDKKLLGHELSIGCPMRRLISVDEDPSENCIRYFLHLERAGSDFCMIDEGPFIA